MNPGLAHSSVAPAAAAAQRRYRIPSPAPLAVDPGSCAGEESAHRACRRAPANGVPDGSTPSAPTVVGGRVLSTRPVRESCHRHTREVAQAGAGYRTGAGKITRWRTCSRCSAGWWPRTRIRPPSRRRKAWPLSTAVVLAATLASNTPKISPAAAGSDSSRNTRRPPWPCVRPSSWVSVAVMPPSSGSDRPGASSPGIQSDCDPGGTPLKRSTTTEVPIRSRATTPWSNAWTLAGRPQAKGQQDLPGGGHERLPMTVMSPPRVVLTTADSRSERVPGRHRGLVAAVWRDLRDARSRTLAPCRCASLFVARDALALPVLPVARSRRCSPLAAVNPADEGSEPAPSIGVNLRPSSTPPASRADDGTAVA